MLDNFKTYKYRKQIAGGLLSGLGYATIMAIFDYSDDKAFNILKF